ncbi:uncharacterized protein LOC144711972 [Wolffia australiana]
MVTEDHLPRPCRGGSASSSERKQWGRLFRALTEMVQQRQRQAETLAGDRKRLHEYTLLQHARWESKVRRLEARISMMKRVFEMERRAHAASVNLALGIKQIEISRYREEFERAESDLQDFHECVKALNSEISSLKENEEKMERRDSEIRSSSALRGPRNWKQAYKELSSKKEAEVSALLSEKDFVWHQLKKMEGEYTGLLKSKQVEINQSNEAFEKLQATVEELQSLAAKKEETIFSLKGDLSQLKKEALKKDDELEKLQLSIKEKDAVIAKLQRDLSRTETSSKKPARVLRSRKEMNSLIRSGSRKSDSGQKIRSKRKSVVAMSALDSPKLFSSSFKVPKLRQPSFVGF